MSENSWLNGVVKGSLISIICTLFLMIFMAILMVVFDFNEKIYNYFYEFIIAISLVLGSIVAAKINKRKGWLTGFIVSIIFYIFIFMLGSVVSEKLYLSSLIGYKLLIILSLGTISGILGVNM